MHDKNYCDCDYCQLSRYTEETGDWNAAVAYYAAEIDGDIMAIRKIKEVGHIPTHISDNNEIGAGLAVLVLLTIVVSVVVKDALRQKTIIHPRRRN